MGWPLPKANKIILQDQSRETPEHHKESKLHGYDRWFVEEEIKRKSRRGPAVEKDGCECVIRRHGETDEQSTEKQIIW